MPTISMFYGIIIYLYFIDNRQHHIPHIHVKYQEHEAVVSIPDGELLEGNLPNPKMKLLQAGLNFTRMNLLLTGNLLLQVNNFTR